MEFRLASWTGVYAVELFLKRMETVVQMAAIFKESFSTWAYIPGTAPHTVFWCLQIFCFVTLFFFFPFTVWSSANLYHVSFYNPIFISKCFVGYNPGSGRQTLTPTSALGSCLPWSCLSSELTFFCTVKAYSKSSRRDLELPISNHFQACAGLWPEKQSILNTLSSHVFTCTELKITF